MSRNKLVQFKNAGENNVYNIVIHCSHQLLMSGSRYFVTQNLKSVPLEVLHLENNAIQIFIFLSLKMMVFLIRIKYYKLISSISIDYLYVTLL